MFVGRVKLRLEAGFSPYLQVEAAAQHEAERSSDSLIPADSLLPGAGALVKTAAGRG